jgi:hypothetical protein
VMSAPFIVKKAARLDDELSGSMLWRSRSVAVCRVTRSGRILCANARFHALIRRSAGGSAGIDIATCFSPARRRKQPRDEPAYRDLITRTGERIPVVVETLVLPEQQEEIWLVVPEADGSTSIGARQSREAILALLNTSMAGSIAALARNLHRVSERAPASAASRAELIRSSLALVEQCSLDVRQLARMLRPSIQPGRMKSVEKSCA